MASLLFQVDRFVLNVSLCVARHAIHDTEAGRLKSLQRHSV
jgi:hypothetical protein